MDFENLINDPIGYTREAFAARWVRWLIFVILGLPLPLAMQIFRYSFDPEAIVAGATFHWEEVPWVPILIFVLAGILASFVIGGYSVRVYRGIVPAPDFTSWPSLFIDGIRLDIVILGWFLPFLVVFLAQLALGLWMLTSPGVNGIPWFLPFLFLIIPVELILLIGAFLFMIPGTVRFARTGSMAEGWNFSAIREILGRIGWVNYFIVLVFYVVIAIVYTVAVSIPAMIPWIGWIFPVLTAPFLTVFTARYFTLVYLVGELPPGPLAPEPVPPVA